MLLCDGHHTQLHEGHVSISGRAPDALVFVRDGRRLVDPRAPSEQAAVAELRQLAPAPSLHAPPAARGASRFGDVVELEAATQALRQLGYKTRDARRALARVCAYVGTDADIPTLVRAVLDLNRQASHSQHPDDESPASLATRALVQAGFSAALATQAVAQRGNIPIAGNVVGRTQAG